jgi:hypothetical protein
MARLQTTSATRQFDAAIKGTQEQIREKFVAFAKRANAEVLATDPRPATFTRYVDGRQDAPEETVRQNGVIVYKYSRLDLVAEFAIETLRKLSPVGIAGDGRPGHPGMYIENHIMLIGDVQTDDVAEWQPGQEIILTNLVPYSRKIELGLMKMRVPGSSMVYQQAESIVKRNYGNLADIRYTFRGFVGGALAKGTAHGKSDNRYPALVIREKS